MSGHFCRDKKVGGGDKKVRKLGEGTKKYGTFYLIYAIESDIICKKV